MKKDSNILSLNFGFFFFLHLQIIGLTFGLIGGFALYINGFAIYKGMSPEPLLALALGTIFLFTGITMLAGRETLLLRKEGKVYKKACNVLGLKLGKWKKVPSGIQLIELREITIHRGLGTTLLRASYAKLAYQVNLITGTNKRIMVTYMMKKDKAQSIADQIAQFLNLQIVHTALTSKT